MAKMKISEIAKSLNMKSSALAKLLNENGFENVRSAQSSIEDDAIGWILQNVRPNPEPESEAVKPVKKPALRAAKKTGKASETKTRAYVSDAEELIRAEESRTMSKAAGENKEAEKAKPVKKKKDAEAQTAKADKAAPKAAGKEAVPASPSEDKRQDGRPAGTSEQSKAPEKGQGRSDLSSRQEKASKRSDSFSRNQERGSKSYGSNGAYDKGRGNGQRGYGDRNGSQKSYSSDRGSKSYGSNGPYSDKGRAYGGQKDRDHWQGGEQKGRQGFSYGKNERKSSSSAFDFGAPMTKNNGNRSNGHNNKGRNKEKVDWDAREAKAKKDPNRKGAFIKPAPLPEKVDDGIKNIVLPEVMTIKELAEHMKIPAAQVIKKLFLQGKAVSINQDITFEEAEEIALEFNCIAEMEEKVNVIEELLREDEEDESLMKKRPPVVCVMGHVDHGKTSLLDAIRRTKVTEKEAGGITQHIGAYVVKTNDNRITFLDTPGHEAFTSMRMRGAKSTDIAILVVAADDGVMPQTIEAISHAKAAGVEIIVAVNKIDKEGANVERVKQELTEYELIPEDWGGSTIFVPVSAHTKEGITQLLEMITLTADIMELKANPDRKARGIVIEAQLDKGRGPVATILVQKGTLKVGDSIAIGSAYGKVRAMMDDNGRRVKEAKPSTPVEILGLNEVPNAGEIFIATESDKEARNIAEAYIKEDREKLLGETKAKLSLDGLFSQIQAGNIKELNIIVKADVQGSVEAVRQSLLKLSNDEVAVRIIHAGVGAINESDVSLASASNAIIIGFNVRPDNMAKDIAEREKVDLRLYKVIYNAIEDVEAAMKGLLDPVYEERVIGHAEVRQIFKASGVGNIAGSYVLDGKVQRSSSARITREGELIFEGELASLKRFKDDVKEVKEGYECGLVFSNFNDIQEGDQIEFYIMEEVPR